MEQVDQENSGCLSVLLRLFGFSLALVLVLAAAFGLTVSVSAQGDVPSRDAPPGGPCSAPSSIYGVGATDDTITSGGLEREFIVYVPDGLTRGEPAPLVYSLHGFGGSAPQHRTYTDWDEVAETNGMIVVYPQGSGRPARWYSGSLFQERLLGDNALVDDVQFFRDLTDHLRAYLCIDPARIYVNGLSNGGGMSYLLSCEASDLFAAWSGVAGAYSVDPDSAACQPERALPALLFHGTEDGVVDYRGNPDAGLPDIETFFNDLAEANECVEPVEEAEGEIIHHTFADCNTGAPVELYTIIGGGHTWPGANPLFILGGTTDEISASELQAAFFLRYANPAASEG